MPDETKYREIFYAKEEDGWYVINGDTCYDLTKWTKEEAEADYTSFESYVKDLQFKMEAFGYYD